ncbi:MAG: NAD(+) diphosphatase [Dehalococcoidia bacterium]|nr:NAD(+) diphosphatase [Dehalococcoidia bacterium]
MTGPIPFSANPLDRASNQRHDDAWVEAQLRAAGSRYLAFSQLNVLTSQHSAPELLWLDCTACDSLAAEAPRILLGLRDGVAHFAFDLPGTEDPASALGLDGAVFSEVRGLTPSLTPEDAGIVAQARALLDWHNRNRFCGACGSPTSIRKAGSSRKCDGCGAECFPRTDPVVIMVIMVVWRGDRCLLGRRAGRPAGSFSALAGFVDQGETIEEAVRREVLEEVGVVVDDVEYHASQPWPFPSSLMIGCFAHAAGDEAQIDDIELAEATWFTRDQVRTALASPSAFLTIPGPIAIAHHLLRDWSQASV